MSRAGAGVGSRCKTCQHKQRRVIDEALARGIAASEVARRFQLPTRSVQRHAKDHLPEAMLKSEEAREAAHADSLLEEVRGIMTPAQLLLDACDRWLRDPDDPDRYYIGPRVEDVIVTCTEYSDGNRVSKNYPLAELLGRLEELDVIPEKARYSHADPRELILKAAKELRSSLELLARLTDKLPDPNQTIIENVHVYVPENGRGPAHGG